MVHDFGLFHPQSFDTFADNFRVFSFVDIVNTDEVFVVGVEPLSFAVVDLEYFGMNLIDFGFKFIDSEFRISELMIKLIKVVCGMIRTGLERLILILVELFDLVDLGVGCIWLEEFLDKGELLDEGVFLFCE